MRRSLALLLPVLAALAGCAGFERLKSHNLCHTRRGRATGTTCAVSPGKELFCWGSNERGQVGNDGFWSYYGSPQRVEGLSGVTAHDEGGHYHACAVAKGELSCWGENLGGALGQAVQDRGSYLDVVYKTPRPVKLPQRALSVVAGFSHTCAVTAARELHCWGTNDMGQLGFSPRSHDRRQGCEPALFRHGSFCDRPQRVALDGVVAAAAGSFHTCALTADGRVHCWGLAGDSERDHDRDSDSDRDDPRRLARLAQIRPMALPAARAIAARGSRTCAVTTAGELHCWGPYTGPLGGLGRDRHVRPTRVEGLSGVAAVAVGESHLCALTRKGELLCRGDNEVGQLGLGDTWHRRPGCRWLRNSRCVGHDERYCHTLQRVPLEGVKSVHLSGNASVAVTTKGVYFWGGKRGTAFEGRPVLLEL